jgi:hypothetical protein
MTRGHSPERERVDGWQRTIAGRQWLKAKRLHGWRRAFAMEFVVAEIVVIGVIVALALLSLY